MFPNADLFSKQRPENPTAFNSRDRYLTAMTQESAFLDELFQHFPDRLHGVMESSYFSDLVRITYFNTICWTNNHPPGNEVHFRGSLIGNQQIA